MVGSVWYRAHLALQKAIATGPSACPEKEHKRVDSDRERREAELGRIAGSTSGVRGAGELRAVQRVSQDGVRQAARRGTREALDEKEQEESGGGGLYGSQIDASHLVGAAIAELV